jgi:glycosyltransferase involved in cell wall biosynthesis
MEKYVSIVIPAHNEEKRIGKTLEEYGRFFREKKKEKQIKDFEIVVVLNACKDNTIEVVENAEKKYREINHLEFKRAGKGFAISEGFKYSINKKADLVGFVDADMATKPEDFYILIRGIKNFQGAIASRYVPGSRTRITFLRWVVSRVFNFFVRVLFLIPYKDTQCGAKLFKKEALQKVIPKLGMTLWAYDIDLLYNFKKQGFRIREIPTKWQDIEGSKLNVKKVSVQMFLAVIQLRILRTKLRRTWPFFQPFASLLYKTVK